MTNLLQLIHEVRRIDFDLVIRVVKAPLNDLVHDMEIACRIGDLVSSCSIAGVQIHAHQ